MRKITMFYFLAILFLSFTTHAQCGSSSRADTANFFGMCAAQDPYNCGSSEHPVYMNYYVRTWIHPYYPNEFHYQCGLACPGGEFGGGFGHIVYNCHSNFISKTSARDVEAPFCSSGSIINTTNRTVAEAIHIVDTGFELVYASSNVMGRALAYRVEVPITGNDVDVEITGYTIKSLFEPGATVVDVQTFGNSTNQNYIWTWNGQDAFSSLTWGPVQIRVEITEDATDFDTNFSQVIVVGDFKAIKLGVGGWTPSTWRFYSSVANKIYNPDGSFRQVEGVVDGSFVRVPEDDGSVVYYFDSVGRLDHVKTGLTGQTIRSFSYDGSGRLSAITEPFGRVTTFHRNGSGILTSIEAPNGSITNISVNGNGYLASVANPLSETYSMTYGTDGLLATFTKPNLAVSTFTYDVDGNLISDIHSGGSGLTLSQSGNVISLLTSLSRQSTLTTSRSNASSFAETYAYPDGSIRTRSYSLASVYVSDRTAETNFQFDAHGRFGQGARRYTGVTRPAMGERTTYLSETINSLDPDDPFVFASSEVIATNGPSEVTTTYTSSTKTFLQESKLGRTLTRVIDSYERPISDQVGNQNAVSYTYTDENLTGLTQGTRSTSFTYNPTTNYLTSVTNALGQVTGFTYNSAGRLTSKIFPDTRSIAYQYDSVGNLVSLTPPSRPAHTWNIGAHETVTSYVPPALGLSTVTTSYSYNLDKQLTQITRPDAQTIAYNYNSGTGVLNSVVTPSGTMAFSYSGGRVENIEAPSQWRSWIGYDSGVPVSLALYEPSMSWSPWISYYASGGDHFDTIASESLSDQMTTRTTIYTYDDDGALTSTGQMSLSYNLPNGQITGTISGSVTDTYTYNSYGEVTGYEAKYSGTTIYSYTLARDLLGRVTEKVETLNAVTTDYDYTYDSSGRLTQVEKNGVVDSTYTYDSNSNRASASIHGVSFTGTYDDQDRLTSYNVFDLGYNLNGELESKTNTLTSQVVTYVSDVFGQQTQVILPSKTVNYEIDPMGRRLGVLWGSTLQKRYFYDLKGRLIAEFDENGEIQKRYVYATRDHVPDYYVNNSNQVFRLITDHLGSVRLVVRADTGTVTQRMEHDEFGRVLQDTNPGTQPFGFAGGLYDAETGLVRFGARDYDPETGRWTSKDPILFNGGDTNLYGYVMNDPVNFVDPNGLWSISLSGYLGLGGGVTFGVNPDGGTFSGVRAGFGLGAGANFDPNGTSPSYNSCTNRGATTGVFGEVGANLGPFEVGYSSAIGINQSSGAYRRAGFSPVFNPSIGIGIGAAVGIEFLHEGKR